MKGAEPRCAIDSIQNGVLGDAVPRVTGAEHEVPKPATNVARPRRVRRWTMSRRIPQGQEVWGVLEGRQTLPVQFSTRSTLYIQVYVMEDMGQESALALCVG